MPHQAIAEFVAAVTRPLRDGHPLLAVEEARREAEELLNQFTVLFPTAGLLRLAIRGAATYQLSWFDAHLWAYAELYGLSELWSEDFQHDRRRLRLASADVADAVELDLDHLDPRPRHHWSDYVRGVALMLGRAGVRLRGADLLVGTSIPIGGGLSSSAALEVAAGHALLTLAAAPVELRALALACQRAENEVVGNRCGIMDPFIACCGEAGRVLLLDCRSLEHRALPLPDDVRVVVCDTLVRHQLAGSEYNARRADCEEGVRRLKMDRREVSALRDLTREDLQRGAAGLPPVVLRRCRHVIGENARVLDAAAALGRGDLAGFGLLMSASHRSLRDDYEVSCRELDLLVELAAPVQGVYGTRMTGGGFGGCTVTLVRADGVQALVKAVTAGYREAAGRTPRVHVCSLDAGVAEVT